MYSVSFISVVSACFSAFNYLIFPFLLSLDPFILSISAGGSFSERDFTHAQKVLRILSGLHGVLRPLDLIQPYRLEMGSKVATDRGDSLYDFWGETITEILARDIAASPGANALVNLASNEYFGAVRPQLIDGRIVTPRFLDAKADGDYATIGFFAKRARGAMAGWIVRERITAVSRLVDFDADGYRFDPGRSTDDEPVFVRRSD